VKREKFQDLHRTYVTKQVNFNHFLIDQTVYLNLVAGNMFGFISFYEVEAGRGS
jgi:hypothetical protein